MWLVDAIDTDTFSPPDRLATGMTDAAGAYRLCFNNGGDERGTQDVYVLARALNPWWTMAPNVNQPEYSFRTPQRSNIPDGTTGLGPPQVPAELMRAVEAFDTVAAVWDFVAPNAGDHCWNGRPGRQCARVQVLWNPTAKWMGPGNWCDKAPDCYRPERDTVFLQGNTGQPNSNSAALRNVIGHEVGHAIMDLTYGRLPDRTNCDDHNPWMHTSEACAWVEGFAEWVGIAAFGDTVFVGHDVSIDREAPTWGWSFPQPWGTGETVEGRVTSFLLDVVDANNEGPWDRHTEDVSNIWRTFRGHFSSTLMEFWDVHRRADGLPVDTPEIAATFYQNTIFVYFFFDHLPDYAEQSRPAQGIMERYRFDTNTPFWSVVAVRPASGGSTNLFLLDNPNADLLNASTRAGPAINFVAVDSNRRPFGDYYVWATHPVNGPVGTNYQVELAQGRDILGANSSQTVFMGTDDVVVVRDTLLFAGQTVRFLVLRTNGSQNPDLFIMGSDPNDATTWTPSADGAAASATSGLDFEDLTFTAPTSGFYGVVVVNAAGAGNYNLLRFD